MLCDKSRARDLLIRAKIAIVGGDVEFAEKCLETLKREFAASTSRKYIRMYERFLEKRKEV